MDLTSKLIKLCLLSLIYTYKIVESCLKQSDPTSGSSGSNPNPNQPSSTTIYSGPQMTCTPAERASQQCLSGGTCYATLFSSNGRTLHCSCPSGYEGVHCESKSGPNIGYNKSGFGDIYDIPAIVLIVLGIVLLFIIVAVIVFLVVRKRRRDSRPKLGEPNYPDIDIDSFPDKNSRSSNYAAARHYQETNRTGVTNVAFVSDIQSYPNPMPYSMLGAVNNSSKKNGTLVGEADERDNPSSRPSSSTGGSVIHHNNKISGSLNVPLAFHETTI